MKVFVDELYAQKGTAIRRFKNLTIGALIIMSYFCHTIKIYSVNRNSQRNVLRKDVSSSMTKM
jgi:hypothetical protein